jgi:hypothetical protein
VKHRVNADQGRDARYRAEAVKAWHAFRAYIKRRATRIGKEKFRHIGARIRIGPPKRVIAVILEEVSEDKLGSAWDTITLNILPQNWRKLRPHKRTEWLFATLWEIPGVEATFIHEMTHWMDARRATAKEWEPISGYKHSSGDTRGYFTTPEEYNAFYQEGARRLEQYILSDDRGYRIRDFDQTLRRGNLYPFYDLWDKDFITYIHKSKYRKKFMLRLAGLLQMLARKYPSRW